MVVKGNISLCTALFPELSVRKEFIADTLFRATSSIFWNK